MGYRKCLLALVILTAVSVLQWLYLAGLLTRSATKLRQLTTAQHSNSSRLPGSSVDNTHYKSGVKVTEQELLRRVNRLPFKVKPPSKLQLDDPYFSPSAVALEVYNSSILRRPAKMACGGAHSVHVLVPSPPDDVATRNAIRETWGSVARGVTWPGKELSMPVKLTFVIGVTGQRENFKDEKQPRKAKRSAEDNAQFKRDKVLRLTKDARDYHNFKRLSSAKDKTDYHQAKGFSLIRDNMKDNIVEDLPSTKDAKQATNSFSTRGAIEDHRTKGPPPTKEAKKDIEPLLEPDDVLQFDMLDSYSNLTRKMLLALRWVVSTCENLQYIAKVDQDVFVNVPLLLSFLKHHGKNNSIYGHTFDGRRVHREGRWANSRLAYPPDKYPVYAAGTAYVLSKDAAETVLRLSPYFPYVPIEDAFITGVLASVGNVDRVHVAGFTHSVEPEPPPCAFVNDKIYFGNKMAEFDLRRIWRRLIDRGRDDNC